MAPRYHLANQIKTCDLFFWSPLTTLSMPTTLSFGLFDQVSFADQVASESLYTEFGDRASSNSFQTFAVGGMNSIQSCK